MCCIITTTSLNPQVPNLLFKYSKGFHFNRFADWQEYMSGVHRDDDVDREAHYHASAASCFYPAVSIPDFPNGFGTFASKNSWRSVNNLTVCLVDCRGSSSHGNRGMASDTKLSWLIHFFQPTQRCSVRQRYSLMWHVQQITNECRRARNDADAKHPKGHHCRELTGFIKVLKIQ